MADDPQSLQFAPPPKETEQAVPSRAGEAYGAGHQGSPDGQAHIQLNPGSKTNDPNDQAKMKQWFRKVEAALSSKSLWEWLVVGASPGLGMGIEIHKRVNPASAASQHGQHAQPLVPADKGKAP